MSDKSQQKEIKDSNPARVNLMVEVLTNGAMKKTELPLRLLVLGDFTGRESGVPVAKREAININKDNFDGVMQSLDLGATLNVRDRLRGGEEEMPVELRFKSRRDFRPERVASQIPQVTRLVAARNLLEDLKSRVSNVAEFRKQLQRIVQDPAAVEQLVADLQRVVPGDAPARIAAAVEPAAGPPAQP